MNERETWRVWWGKFMTGAGIKEYHIQLTGTKKILFDDADEIK